MRDIEQQPVNVGVIGAGSVGGGVANSFAEGRFTPYNVVLKTVAVKDPSKIRDIQLPDSARLIDNANAIIDDPEIDIVVEVMGGTDLARDYSFKTLEADKHLVTANKALLGENLPELFDLANKHKVSLSFEASVCGAIPIIQNLRDYLRLQKVSSIRGILNGTTNYILSRMEDGMDFDPALEEAQSLGIAETNHILDTGGFDTRSKLAILASIASGAHIKPENIPCQGITEITQADITFAREFGRGYAIKLLASAEQYDGTWRIKVSPALINKDNPLASVRGKLNSVTIEGDLSGPLTFTGFGASRNPTAGAVIADILHAAKHVRYHTPDFLPELKRQASITKPEDVLSRGYIRTQLLHLPGTLGEIATFLGKHHLNIRALLQRAEAQEIGGMPYTHDIITLEPATEGQIAEGLRYLAESPLVQDTPFYMQIEE